MVAPAIRSIGVSDGSRTDLRPEIPIVIMVVLNTMSAKREILFSGLHHVVQK